MATHDPKDQEFVALLTDHQEMLRSFIASLIPNHPDVRDLLQEINIVLWEKRGTFKLGTKFAAWACTVARYKAMNESKKLQRANWLVFSDALLDTLASESADRSPALLDSKRHALKHCVTKLRPTDQKLLNARYTSSDALDGYALESGRNRASLRVTLARLRAALRRCIEQRLAMEKNTA